MTSRHAPSKGLRGLLRLFEAGISAARRITTLLFEVVRVLQLRYVFLKPRPDDIYIVTFPKAGTTWMQQMVYQLLHQGRGEYEHISQVAPYIDLLCLAPYAEQVLDALPSPRILKTHLRRYALRPPASSRIIYVTRGVSDSLLSQFHHRCLMRGLGMDFDEFLRRELAQDHWGRHLVSWWPHRNDPNVLHLRFEDLVADREACLRRLAGFLSVPLRDEDLPAILEKTSFEYMKQRDARFDPRLARYEPRDGDAGFIRQGRVGGARGLLKPEQQSALEAKEREVRRKLGIASGGI